MFYSLPILASALASAPHLLRLPPADARALFHIKVVTPERADGSKPMCDLTGLDVAALLPTVGSTYKLPSERCMHADEVSRGGASLSTPLRKLATFVKGRRLVHHAGPDHPGLRTRSPAFVAAAAARRTAKQRHDASMMERVERSAKRLHNRRPVAAALRPNRQLWLARPAELASVTVGDHQAPSRDLQQLANNATSTGLATRQRRELLVDEFFNALKANCAAASTCSTSIEVDPCSKLTSDAVSCMFKLTVEASLCVDSGYIRLVLDVPLRSPMMLTVANMDSGMFSVSKVNPCDLIAPVAKLFQVPSFVFHAILGPICETLNFELVLLWNVRLAHGKLEFDLAADILISVDNLCFFDYCLGNKHQKQIEIYALEQLLGTHFELLDPAPIEVVACGLSSWTCDAAWFNANDGCDCNCGSYDPDCDIPHATLYNCNDDAKYSCSATGSCIPWTCSEGSFGTGDGCQCNCNAFDPDCWSSTEPVYGCCNSSLFGSSCPNHACAPPEGTCMAKPYPPPAGWTCPTEWYNGSDGCDCNCGAW